MTYREAIRLFKETHPEIGTRRLKVDYWTAQYAWSCFVDALCKDGQITQKQYDTWLTPFKYPGK